MTGYSCTRCRLAFEIGSRANWDRPGGCTQCACRRCGTMHQIEISPGCDALLCAASGPALLSMIEPPAGGEDVGLASWSPDIRVAWRPLGPLHMPAGAGIVPRPFPALTAEIVDRLACTSCGAVGSLVSSLADGEACPVCAGVLEVVYVSE